MKLIQKIKNAEIKKNITICFRLSQEMKEALEKTCKRYNIKQGTALRSMVENFIRSTL